eukprot:774074-Prorocentrum_minimum.AAC.3
MAGKPNSSVVEWRIKGLTGGSHPCRRTRSTSTSVTRSIESAPGLAQSPSPRPRPVSTSASVPDLHSVSAPAGARPVFSSFRCARCRIDREDLMKPFYHSSGEVAGFFPGSDRMRGRSFVAACGTLRVRFPLLEHVPRVVTPPCAGGAESPVATSLRAACSFALIRPLGESRDCDGENARRGQGDERGRRAERGAGCRLTAHRARGSDH